jgi:hypothetical protein
MADEIIHNRRINQIKSLIDSLCLTENLTKEEVLKELTEE